jgi:toxin ParE1/3/4
MKYQFHPEALTEFRESAVFYESRQAGLGDRFVSAVEVAIDRILASPQTGRVLEDDVRRYLTKVFPYAVLYSIESDYILIVAVMHCHREPLYWQNRVVGNQ